MRQTSLVAICFLLGATSAVAGAQTVRTVGPGGFAQIRDAIAVSQPSDVIEVHPGTYAHFSVTTALVIRAVTPGTVFVVYDPAFTPPSCLGNPFCVLLEGPTDLAPPAGTTLHIVGLVFEPSVVTTTFPAIRHRVRVLGGAVAFEQCTITANETTALQATSAAVHLQDCVVAGTGFAATAHGVVATNAHIDAVASYFGGNLNAGFVFPGDGMRLTNSTLKASGSTWFGGTQLLGGVGGAGLRTDSASRVWLRDATVTGGGTTCALVGTPLVGRAENSTFVSVGSCTGLPTGPVTGVERSGPFENGSSFTTTVRSAPFDTVFLFASLGLKPNEIGGGIVEQPLSLEESTRILLGVHTADAQGVFAATFDLPPGLLVGIPIWLGAATLGATLPVQVPPPVGGVVR